MAFPDRHLSWLGLHLKQAGLGWLYLLIAVPTLTDLVENGRWPAVPREWITEIVASMVIALLVRRVRKEHFAVLALTRLDPLTGLWNRRAFDEVVAELIEAFVWVVTSLRSCSPAAGQHKPRRWWREFTSIASS